MTGPVYIARVAGAHLPGTSWTVLLLANLRWSSSAKRSGSTRNDCSHGEKERGWF